MSTLLNTIREHLANTPMKIIEDKNKGVYLRFFRRSTKDISQGSNFGIVPFLEFFLGVIRFISFGWLDYKVKKVLPMSINFNVDISQDFIRNYFENYGKKDNE